MALTRVTTKLVTFLRAATGAASRTLFDKLSETAVSVKDFGAVGDGTTDDSAAWQACINAAAGRPILMPAGTYRINTALTYNTSGTSPGLKIIGDGFGKSIFSTAVAGGTMLSLDGSGTALQFAMGMILRDFSVRVFGATANATFLSIRSQWNGRVKVDVQDLTGDAIKILNDNSDSDSSAYIDFSGSYLKGCGWGINCVNPTTASSALSGFVFGGVHNILNRSGGYRLLGAAHTLTNGSVSYNQGAGGLVAPYNATATPVKGLTVDNVEFDGNSTYNIDLQAVIQALLRNLKFVYAAPSTSVRIGDGGAGSAVDVVMTNHHHRPDGVSAITAYTFGSNASNITLVNDFYSTTTALTKIAGTMGALASRTDTGKTTLAGVKTGTSQAAATGTAYTPDMSLAVRQRVVFNGASLVINAPLYPSEGQTLILDLFNLSGGSITPTFNAAFVHVAPGAIATSKRRTASFTYSAIDAAWVINGSWSADI